MDRIRWFDKYRPRIVFCKPKTLNAHNFLITWRIRKIQSSPESLFGVHKKYSNHLGSGGQIRTGRVSLNKVFFLGLRRVTYRHFFSLVHILLRWEQRWETSIKSRFLLLKSYGPFDPLPPNRTLRTVAFNRDNFGASLTAF